MARRVAVVTGGTAGVGRATVRLLAERGYDVGVLARGEVGLAATVAEVEQRGGRALALPADVADAGAVEAAAERVERELGPIDLWVNDAFVGVFAPSWELSAEEYARVTAVSYLGFVHGTLAALRRMRPRNAGTIVQVGSALAYRGIPLQAAYCGSKHAIVGFTESVVTELLHEKSAVKVCMVHLPAVNTPQFDWVLSRLPEHPQPVPPIFQPEVAARGIVHMAEHPRRSLWIGFPTWMTILGNRVAASVVDRYLARGGYDSQQNPDVQGMLPPNVWEPVDVDAGAHGSFDGSAKDRSLALDVSIGVVSPIAARSGPLAGAAALAIEKAQAGYMAAKSRLTGS